MPGPEALCIEIRTAGMWRLGSAAVTLAAAFGLVWWSLTAFERGAPGLTLLALPAWLALAAAATMRWICGGCLRWDGEVWRLDGAEQAGTLAVALDGGHWMLLRLRSIEGPAWRRVRWLALSRRDLGGQWHALRCAVYSPRPAPGGSSAADTAHPPA